MRTKMRTYPTTFIYGLVDPLYGGLRYVGKANDPDQRLVQHISTRDEYPSHKNHWIQSLVSKGVRPQIILLERVPMHRWQTSEKEWIQKAREYGFNLTNTSEGGEGPGYHNLGTIDKMSKSHIGLQAGSNHPMFGKQHRPESNIKNSLSNKGIHDGEKNHMFGKNQPRSVKDKISKARSGQKATEESRRINSECRLGEKHPLYGIPKSEESKEKQRNSMTGRTATEETKAKMRKSRAIYIARKLHEQIRDIKSARGV